MDKHIKSWEECLAHGKSHSRWLFLSLIIFIWSSVLPMFSWLRLLIEAISFGVSVLGTEWGIGWICQCLHSWTSSLHFCLYEKCEHIMRVQDGGERTCMWYLETLSFLGTRAKQPHIYGLSILGTFHLSGQLIAPILSHSFWKWEVQGQGTFSNDSLLPVS